MSRAQKLRTLSVTSLTAIFFAIATIACQSAPEEEADSVVEPAVIQREAATAPGMAQHEDLPGSDSEQPAEQAEQPEQPQEAQTQNRSSASSSSNFTYADNRWIEGQEGQLLQGMDGAPYPPYLPRVVEQTQRELSDRGLYDGPISGVLDERTMQAVAEFQKNNGIHPSGVPSPETREDLGIAETENP